ncbi:MAG: hypothetical protein AAGC71_00160 [Pseudomonadota bacterium]
MNVTRLGVFFWLSMAAGAAIADDFAGRYALQGGEAVLTISEPTNGTYTATIYADGTAVNLQGSVVDGDLRGDVQDGTDSFTFTARLSEPALTLTLIANDATGQPVPGAREDLTFVRANGRTVSTAATSNASTGVRINGRQISTATRIALARQYGVEPKPGNYWYDPTSGLYGVVGYQAFGFMMPGHDLGTPTATASSGNTNVFINGRELPQSEWLVWSYMLGTPIMVGSYWLDAQGNAGYTGNPIPVVNLYAAARQNAYRGRGGSGDNFWSTRFSAGNSDGNRGYVSVPGYGPVGYGF